MRLAVVREPVEVLDHELASSFTERSARDFAELRALLRRLHDMLWPPSGSPWVEIHATVALSLPQPVAPDRQP